ncbi:metalloendopeptidase OMA1, mitochondrial [Neodiprion lecontei]|uniref:Metalloendopeptidase OMA1, mitochondrial n=1 Tax=Neodiprion lecontei TaxID=441921 RepID=A0A6J0C9Q3_NEOLC|nr:metalloendopeptidase OMA1, mitochondrial [Neodiprion lecontei]
MFSTLRGVCSASAKFRNTRIVTLVSFPTRSVKNFPKVPVERCEKRLNIPAQIQLSNRKFHTTNRRDIPPVLALILRPVLRIGAFIFGRTLRKWWGKIDPSEREQYAAFLRKKKPYLYGFLGAFFSMLAIYYVLHIENAPITNRPRFIMFTKQQQAAFEKFQLELHLEEHMDKILPHNHPVYQQLLKVTTRLLNANKDLPYIKEKNWTLSVIDLPENNAFVLPGGNIFIFTGILKMIENEDQLSFIIAHEMAHSLLKHAMEQVSNGFIIDVLLLLPIVIIWALFPDSIALILQLTGYQILNIFHDLPYNRALESEADEVGLTLSAKACVDVREAVVFWKMMRSLEELNAEPTNVTWLSTHPNHKDRAENLNGLMSKAIALRGSYQCPGLSPVDPRKKFDAQSIKDVEARLKLRGVL